MKLVSMKRTDEQQHADPVCCPGEQDMPDYPYGTRINLNDPELNALGLADLPPAGSPLKLAAVGIVMGVREEQVDGKLHRSLEIQITELGLQKGDGPSIADRMYPKKA